MADPRVLYVVMTVVLLGLVTWVITVWVSPAGRRTGVAGSPLSRASTSARKRPSQRETLASRSRPGSARDPADDPPPTSEADHES